MTSTRRYLFDQFPCSKPSKARELGTRLRREVTTTCSSWRTTLGHMAGMALSLHVVVINLAVLNVGKPISCDLLHRSDYSRRRGRLASKSDVFLDSLLQTCYFLPLPFPLQESKCPRFETPRGQLARTYVLSRLLFTCKCQDWNSGKWSVYYWFFYTPRDGVEGYPFET